MRFAALRARWYRGYLAGGSLTMAGDNAEHALTYWVMWQQFHSPLLAGFAVISHWVPHLFFGIAFGALADRFDARRIIQAALGLFALASVLWGVLIVTDSLQPWHAVVLLLIHGLASAIWRPADGLMVYDIVGPESLPSGVRLMATGLSLGQLVGPALGAVALFTVGAGPGMFLNVLLYVPFFVYLLRVPVDGHGRRGRPRVRMGLREVFAVVRMLPRYPSILVVMVLQGAVGLFIGSALLPLFPEFGEELGVGDSGLGYGMLIVAMAAGAVIGGLTLEAIGSVRASTRIAVLATVVFASCLLVFALSRSFALTLGALLLAGAAAIASESTSQTVVQLESPDDHRGRFLGAYSVTQMGFRAGSGLLMGVLGALLGVTAAVAIDAAALLAVALVLLAALLVARRRNPRTDPDVAVPLER